MSGLLTRRHVNNKKKKYLKVESFFKFPTIEVEPSLELKNRIDLKRESLLEKKMDNREKTLIKSNDHKYKTEMLDNSSEDDDEEEEKDDWKLCDIDDDTVSSVSDEEKEEEIEVDYIEDKYKDLITTYIRENYKRKKKSNKINQKQLRRRNKGNLEHKIQRYNENKLDNINAKKQNIERRIGFQRRGGPQNFRTNYDGSMDDFGSYQPTFNNYRYDDNEDDMMIAIQNSIMMNIENECEKYRGSNVMTETGLTQQEIYALQTRELTEDDYALLCELDEHVEKPSVEKSIMDEFPSKTINNLDETEIDMCMICFNEIEVGDVITELPRCNHELHQSCLEKWLGECSRKCPICNTIVSEEYED
mmetsp:Transcript_1962/g.2813  ORF Transcript_1962/g.2813 Transcript_1962/m.2813 type:complete len:361 (+) Transcript_1962:131-1213(+)